MLPRVVKGVDRNTIPGDRGDPCYPRWQGNPSATSGGEGDPNATSGGEGDSNATLSGDGGDPNPAPRVGGIKMQFRVTEGIKMLRRMVNGESKCPPRVTVVDIKTLLRR